MKALITGITGQDGAYLARFLLAKGYEVHGIVRRCSGDNLSRLGSDLDRIKLHQGDMLDEGSIRRTINIVQPTEIYNLAAQSFVPVSWEEPVLTAEITAVGVARILDAIRDINPKIRFYQASSSEMFGHVRERPQRETTPFYPRSPYGVSKAFGHWITVNYRESYDIFACSGILFNHESPLRGVEFVTRKIAIAAARCFHDRTSHVKLGNLDARRDWGYAGDYVEAMWLMLQQSEPRDYVIATGEMHSVREFAQLAFERVGLNYQDFVVTDPNLIRPAEVHELCGDATLAKTILDWKPKVDFKGLVNMMVDSELRLLGY